MKKIKLPLEMANGVMVRTLDELKENWDLEKIVGYFGDGRLVTWLNDRYYTDLAEQVEKITAKGAEAQKELCAIFGIEFKQDEVVDAEALAERKRKLDILRQITSDDEVLKNVDSVAFNQEDLADLLDEGVEKIYLCNGKFSVPLNISGKKYIGVADAEVYIGKDELQDFDKLGISFENVRFDEKYQKLVDAKSKKQEEERKSEEERIKAEKSVKVGDIIKLGEWHSDPIEWQVLEVKDGKALLLSKYALACRKYHNSIENITWENCDLRKWLNVEFFQKAFSGDAAKCVMESHVSAHYNPEYSTDPGYNTNDKVFLLSVKEVLKYFKSDEERICMPLSFVKSEGASIADNGACRWWLRSPGSIASFVANVGSYGTVESTGGADCDNSVVRPACWIDLNRM